MRQAHATRIHARTQSVVVLSDPSACRQMVQDIDPANFRFLDAASKPFRAIFDLEPSASRQVVASLAPGLMTDAYLEPLVGADHLAECMELLRRVQDSMDTFATQRLHIELATIFGTVK
jgi:hypothetical protein